jgi:hypothetical protein
VQEYAGEDCQDLDDLVEKVNGFRRGNPIRPLFARRLVERLLQGRDVPTTYADLVFDYVDQIRPHDDGALHREDFFLAAQLVAYTCIKQHGVPVETSRDRLIGVLENEARGFHQADGTEIVPVTVLGQVEGCLLQRTTFGVQFDEDPVADYLAARHARVNEKARTTLKRRVKARGDAAQGLRDALAEVLAQSAKLPDRKP